MERAGGRSGTRRSGMFALGVPPYRNPNAGQVSVKHLALDLLSRVAAQVYGGEARFKVCEGSRSQFCGSWVLGAWKDSRVRAVYRMVSRAPG